MLNIHLIGKNIVDVMRKQPGGQKPNGFISDSSLFIKILKFEALLSRTDWPRYGLQYEELTNSLRSAPEDFYYDETIHKRELYREYSLVREVVYADLFPSVEYGRCVPILRQLRKSVVGDRRC